MEKVINIINEIAGRKAEEKINNGEAFIGKMTKLSNWDLSTAELRVSVDYADPKYVSDSELKELYKKYIDNKVTKLSEEEVFKMIEDAWNSEYRIKDGFLRELYKYIPDVSAINIRGMSYNPDTKKLYIKYVTKETEYIPESDDGYRRETWLTRDVIKEEEIDLIKDFEYAKRIAGMILRDNYNINQFKEDNGYKYKSYSTIMTDVLWVEVIEELKNRGLNKELKDLKEKLLSRIHKYIEEYKNDIKNEKCKINKLQKFASKYLQKIEELNILLENTEFVSSGRRGEPIIKKWGEKIKVFDRSIQAPKPDSEIFIHDYKELDKVIIIKDYEIVNKDKIKKELEKLNRIFIRYIKDWNWMPKTKKGFDDYKHQTLRDIEKYQDWLNPLLKLEEHLKAL